MMDDGVKGEGKDEEVKVQDIAEILLEALENESTAHRPQHRRGARPASSCGAGARLVGVYRERPSRVAGRVRLDVASRPATRSASSRTAAWTCSGTAAASSIAGADTHAQVFAVGARRGR